MARRNSIEDDLEQEDEGAGGAGDTPEEEATIAGGEHLGLLLEEHAAGQFGDLHLQDLSAVMSSKNRKAAAALAAGDGAGGGGPATAAGLQKAAGMGGLQGVVRRAMEKLKIVKDAVRFSTKQHDSFPQFAEDQLIQFVQRMVKQEYFVGQHIVTQNERGDDYCK
eukprot:SAG22_NODE_456_length_10273_cov_3.463436_2_plen_165_part_00